jgi:hypothetical protein
MGNEKKMLNQDFGFQPNTKATAMYLSPGKSAFLDHEFLEDISLTEKRRIKKFRDISGL